MFVINDLHFANLRLVIVPSMSNTAQTREYYDYIWNKESRRGWRWVDLQHMCTLCTQCVHTSCRSIQSPETLELHAQTVSNEPFKCNYFYIISFRFCVRISISHRIFFPSLRGAASLSVINLKPTIVTLVKNLLFQIFYGWDHIYRHVPRVHLWIFR